MTTEELKIKFPPDKFKIWYNKNWNHDYDYYLVQFCSDYFEIWYNEKTFSHKFDYFLIEYCSRFIAEF